MKWLSKGLLVIIFIMNFFILKTAFLDGIYLYNISELQSNEVLSVSVNEKEVDAKEYQKFIHQIKNGKYYSQSHRVQKIRKSWNVEINTSDQKFKILIEDTYKYGYTIYPLRGVNEVTHYRNNEIGILLPQ